MEFLPNPGFSFSDYPVLAWRLPNSRLAVQQGTIYVEIVDPAFNDFTLFLTHQCKSQVNVNTKTKMTVTEYG